MATKYRNIQGYRIAIRKLDNGWYKLSTMAMSMGEEYRQHQLVAHRPTDEDYAKFIRMVEACK